jgi:hypothetical protein
MENFKELSLEEMKDLHGGSWISQTIKIAQKIIEVLAVGEALDEFTDGFVEGYNSVEPWKP